jgi:hypothetical protein
MHYPARSRPFLAALLGAALGALAVTPAPAQQASVTPDSARKLLARYADPILAVHDGYLSTLACVEFPEGGMGVHFINLQTIGPTPDPAKPQVLIYEAVGDSLRLAAVEWFVPLATGITAAPVLFGEVFDGPMDGHQPIMPHDLRHYDLHVWLFKDNPRGMFIAVNPDVKCTGHAYGHMERLEPSVRLTRP